MWPLLLCVAALSWAAPIRTTSPLAPEKPADDEEPAKEKSADKVKKEKSPEAGDVPGPALEAALALTMPAGGLGIGPGLRLAGDAGLAKAPEGLRLGGELDLRFPSGDQGTITAPELATGLDYEARLTVVGLGPKLDYHFGDPEGVRGRIGMGLGLGLLFQGTEGPAGKSKETATPIAIRPQGGVLIPAGPGDVTGTLLIGITPVDLQVVHDVSVAIALAAGYRFGF